MDGIRGCPLAPRCDCQPLSYVRSVPAKPYQRPAYAQLCGTKRDEQEAQEGVAFA